jgi:glucose/arabinose dehydrogenase
MALDVRTAVSFALAITVSTVIAWQPVPPGLPDQPQVIRTAAATVRVSAIKGFVYPWALAFLPNGDMLVSEQSRNTLRPIHQGALDPTPITGIPPVITSKRRDTAGVEVIAHPKFVENHIIYHNPLAMYRRVLRRSVSCLGFSWKNAGSTARFLSGAVRNL